MTTERTPAPRKRAVARPADFRLRNPLTGDDAAALARYVVRESINHNVNIAPLMALIHVLTFEDDPDYRFNVDTAAQEAGAAYMDGIMEMMQASHARTMATIRKEASAQ